MITDRVAQLLLLTNSSSLNPTCPVSQHPFIIKRIHLMTNTTHHMIPPTPPQQPPNWQHSPEQILHITQQSIQSSKNLLDQLTSTINTHNANFQSVITPMAENDIIISLLEPLVSNNNPFKKITTQILTKTHTHNTDILSIRISRGIHSIRCSRSR